MTKSIIIQQKIEQNILGSIAIVTRDDEVHFSDKVYYEGFNGLPLIKQHKMVYQAIGDDVGIGIHALSIKTTAKEAELT